VLCFLVSILGEVYLCLLFLFCLLCDVINRIYFLQSQKEQYEKHHNTADGRIRIWFGLRQIMNATDRLLLETRDVAQKLNTGIHMVLTQSLLVYWSLSTLNNALLRLVHAYMIEAFMHSLSIGLSCFQLGHAYDLSFPCSFAVVLDLIYSVQYYFSIMLYWKKCTELLNPI